MRILVVSQYFYPENFRINQLCLDLKERGHTITVLTGKPNYPEGKYFSGYTFKGNEDEVWNDIPIYRVPLRARKKGSFNLLRNYFSFVWNGRKRIIDLEGDFDIIYVFEVSPITVVLPAITLKNKKHIPIIVNVQDLWPENIVAVTGINNRFVLGCINKLVDYIYDKSDLLLCSSPSFLLRIQRRVSDDKKVAYWPQYATVNKNEKAPIFFDESKFNIVFTGNIGEAQGIDIAIETAKELAYSNIHWHFIGEGRRRKQLEELSIKYQLEGKVFFHGFKQEKEIPKYLASANAALLILKPEPIFEMTIPAKLQTYLICGIPIIGCVSGEGKRIVEESRSGIVSDDISVKGLKESCLKMLNLSKSEMESYRINAFKYGKKEFNKEKLIMELEKQMEELKNESV